MRNQASDGLGQSRKLAGGQATVSYFIERSLGAKNVLILVAQCSSTLYQVTYLSILYSKYIKQALNEDISSVQSLSNITYGFYSKLCILWCALIFSRINRPVCSKTTKCLSGVNYGSH